MHASAMTAWMEVMAAVAVRGAWESLLLAGFLALLLRRIPGLSPQAGFRAWGAGFALAAFLPWCPDGLRTGFERYFSDIFQLVQQHASSPMQGALQGTATMAQVGAGHTPLLHLSTGWAEVVCALWTVATMVALLRFVVGVWSLRRLVCGAVSAPAAVQVLYRELIQEDGRASRRARRARLLVAEGLSTPSACGLFGGCILLPDGLVESLSEEELECVLRHEAAHLRRHDDWWTIAARLVRTAMPLAVGLTYLDRQMARAREMACDDAALGRGAVSTGNAVRYAACLARLADKPATQPWRGLAPGLTHGLGRNGSQLAARVGHILHSGEALVRPGRLRLAAATIACVGMASALLAAPTVFSFSSGSRLPHVAAGPLPELVSPQPTAMLAVPKTRPAMLPVHRHFLAAVQAEARFSTPARVSTVLRMSAAGRARHKVRLQFADAPLKSVHTSEPALLKSPKSLFPPPQSVLLFWSGAEGWDGSNLVLLFTNPDGQSPADGTRIVLLNI
jgi:beta-lactamase regulating signal transducer with metallopeptidase domain